MRAFLEIFLVGNPSLNVYRTLTSKDSVRRWHGDRAGGVVAEPAKIPPSSAGMEIALARRTHVTGTREDARNSTSKTKRPRL